MVKVAINIHMVNTLCTGRKLLADLVKDCNNCKRFRSSMIVDSEKVGSWLTIKPNSNESCKNYLPKK